MLTKPLLPSAYLARFGPENLMNNKESDTCGQYYFIFITWFVKNIPKLPLRLSFFTEPVFTYALINIKIISYWTKYSLYKNLHGLSSFEIYIFFDRFWQLLIRPLWSSPKAHLVLFFIIRHLKMGSSGYVSGVVAWLFDVLIGQSATLPCQRHNQMIPFLDAW